MTSIKLRFGAITVRFVAALVLAIGSTSPIRAQNPVQTVFAPCPTTVPVLSERQVQVVAKAIVDSTASPRPVVARMGDANTIALTVDTLGVPEAHSLVRLRLADTLLWRRVETGYQSWRFQPALASGCKVRQRVVVAVK